jgi:hypothetical protein
MDSGRDAPPGDMLQVIRRRAPSLGLADGTGSVSVRIRLAPARRRKLTLVVVAALGACTLILVAAGIAHLARANNETSALAATEPSAIAPPAPGAAPVAAPAAPPVDIPQTGTLRLQRPATAGKVWLDGQKITTAWATVACGSHQVKLGAHGKPHAVDVPCGGELRLSK